MVVTNVNKIHQSSEGAGGGGGITYDATPLVGDVLARTGANTAGKATFTNATAMWITVGGYTPGTTFAGESYEDMWNDLLYPYTAPTCTITCSVPQVVYEFGNVQAPNSVQATTVKFSDNIVSPLLYERSDDGAAYATINSQAITLPNGGAEPAFADPVGVGATGIANIRYRSTITDGTTAVQSNVITYNVVYPYYWGVGAVGLTAPQVAALTKTVKLESNSAVTTSPTNQVWYYAFPAAYGLLTDIKDKNGFSYNINQADPLKDWLIRTENITGLDGTPQSYYIYEYLTLTTQVNYTNTFYI